MPGLSGTIWPVYPSWFYEPLDVFLATLVAIDGLALIEGVPLTDGNHSAIGKFGFLAQLFKTIHQLGVNGTGDVEHNTKAVMDLIANAVGTFGKTGGYLGGLQYIVIDRTVGLDNYHESFKSAVERYSNTNNPFMLGPWKR